MTKRKIVAGTAGLALMAAGGIAAVSASGSGSAESSATNLAVVKQKHPLKFKANRYIQDGLRFNKDVYEVNSGGTLRVVNNKATEGPHTVSIVKRKDLPTNIGEVFNCKACNAAVQGPRRRSERARARRSSISSRTARARTTRRTSTGPATRA